MKKIRLLLALVVIPLSAHAASTINSTNAYTWGANIGWLNWRPSAADGVSIGRYICSGYVYSANVGWINMGNGNPVNHIQYANNSAADFGVNFTPDPNNSGHGLLRGYAYGANIGWINFEATGNPYVIISNGQLRGYIYSANCGWINLDDLNYFVSTDTIDPGVDSDNDGLPDAWEYTYFGGIVGVDPNADPDGDGETNIGEYRAGTDPTNTTSVLHSARQLNISTRMRVLTDDNVLIGGFVIKGPTAKKVIVRAMGPSLTATGVPNVLADPTLELHDHTGAIIASNDNWKVPDQATIQATGFAPGNDNESAIVQTLAPASYTAIIRGAGNTTGVGLVEVYDLGDSTVKLANISSRGFVDTNDNVMIGGFIVGKGLGNTGTGTSKVMVRGIGPSLANFGIANPLPDPTLELHDGNGNVLATNDNWKIPDQAAIQATGFAPNNDLESAILVTLPKGAYTAIVRGNNSGTGIGLVEVYGLQ